MGYNHNREERRLLMHEKFLTLKRARFLKRQGDIEGAKVCFDKVKRLNARIDSMGNLNMEIQK